MFYKENLTGKEKRSGVKPLSWFPSILILLILGSLYYLLYYKLVPAYIKNTGQPYLMGYLMAWGISMGAVLLVSLILYTSEGHGLTWKSFAARYRLSQMAGKDWLLTLTVLLVAAGCYFGLSGTARWMGSIPVFSPHPTAPVELRPGAASNFLPRQFFGMAIQGQWWVVIVYFFGWIFNILGEEFFYRGWMLPRQEMAFHKYAWLVNGTMFTFQHWMQPYNFLAIWPGALFMALIVQRRQNTWIGIIQHGLMNFSLFVVLLRGVIG